MLNMKKARRILVPLSLAITIVVIIAGGAYKFGRLESKVSSVAEDVKIIKQYILNKQASK